MAFDTLKIVLADDDKEDRLLFKEAIDEIGINTDLSLFKDGQELMDFLNSTEGTLPHVVFLDLNMPVKNGMECLEEIRNNDALNSLSVAIYSTSSSEKDIENTFLKGANIYINKPNTFSDLKGVIKKVLQLNWQYQTSNLNKDNFLFRM
jgi:CheY-like chemotaxis protein